MMMHAYDKTYLEEAMSNLAVMIDYGTIRYGVPDIIFDRFLVSNISKQFGDGNPRYISGMSGIELAEHVIADTGGYNIEIAYKRFEKTDAYWAGWALSYYQWFSGYTFEKLNEWSITIRYMLTLYPTHHEADLSKVVETLTQRISEIRKESTNPLKKQRKSIGLTQRELADKTGVNLRMIRAYEQGYQDISKAEAASVIRLSKVLNCSVEDLIP